MAVPATAAVAMAVAATVAGAMAAATVATVEVPHVEQ